LPAHCQHKEHSRVRGPPVCHCVCAKRAGGPVC
jgi:hypothetical protein